MVLILFTKPTAKPTAKLKPIHADTCLIVSSDSPKPTVNTQLVSKQQPPLYHDFTDSKGTVTRYYDLSDIRYTLTTHNGKTQWILTKAA